MLVYINIRNNNIKVQGESKTPKNLSQQTTAASSSVPLTNFRPVARPSGGRELRVRRVWPRSRRTGRRHGLPGGRREENHRGGHQPGQVREGPWVRSHRLRQPQGSPRAHPGGRGEDDGGRRGLRRGVRRESSRHGGLLRGTRSNVQRRRRRRRSSRGACCSVLQTSALESTRDAWGVCVIAGWTETEAMSVKVEKLLMGRTLTGTYFGGKCEEAIKQIFFFLVHAAKRTLFWICRCGKTTGLVKPEKRACLVFFSLHGSP